MAVCAECTYLDTQDKNDSGAFWCNMKLERHLATDPECGRFCRAYSRNENTISNAIEYSNNHTNSSLCYLTTMICNILKMNDKNIYLETIRNFRDNVLKNDEQYKQLLVEYDIIGPKIASALDNDPLKDKIAQMYFNYYIIPIINLIQNNKYKEAVNKYVDMTAKLKSFYNINDYSISIEDINNADINLSGHGKYVQKKSLYD